MWLYGLVISFGAIIVAIIAVLIVVKRKTQVVATIVSASVPPSATSAGLLNKVKSSPDQEEEKLRQILKWKGYLRGKDLPDLLQTVYKKRFREERADLLEEKGFQDDLLRVLWENHFHLRLGEKEYKEIRTMVREFVTQEFLLNYFSTKILESDKQSPRIYSSGSPSGGSSSSPLG